MVENAGRRPARRLPDESRREILDAAEELLWQRPLSSLTVGALMDATALGRSSFYVYFDDLDDLVAQLLARLESQLWAAARLWTGDPGSGEGDGQAALAAAVRGVVDVWQRHGPVLRAVVEASWTNAQVHELWREQLMERFVDAVASGAGRWTVDGRRSQRLARETATALLMMNTLYLMDRLGRVPQHDPEEVARALTTVWVRTLYGQV